MSKALCFVQITAKHQGCPFLTVFLAIKKGAVCQNHLMDQNQNLIRTLEITGNPDSVIVPQYGSSKITVFVWGKNTIVKFVGNTKYKSMKLTLQLVVVVLIATTKFRDNLQ